MNLEDDEFDKIVGNLEEIVICPEFETLQKTFFKDSCMQFDETSEENKIEYMVSFKNY